MTTRDDYGCQVFAAWRAAAEPHWSAYTRHAFVAGLADGSLPRAAFLYYLVQDYRFLQHFSRAWALAVVKSEVLDEMRTAAAVVDALLNEEMSLHVQICAAEGIGLAELAGAEEASANLAYTRYVMDAGFSGDLAELLAALAPCVFGYGEIGARLGALPRPAQLDPAYAAWIDTYAGNDYQGLCARMGAYMDAALSRRLGDAPLASPRWPALCARFTTATRLEVDFWAMGLAGPPPTR